MSEIKWYVLVVRGEFAEQPDPSKMVFYVLRAYSWQEAFDSIRKERFSGHIWSLYALEKDGTYFSGLQGFMPVRPDVLAQAQFISKKRE